MLDNIKVLIVASGNAGYVSPFVEGQAEDLKRLKNISIEYFLIKGKGVGGYLKNYRSFMKAVKAFGPDLIHAHYGLSGLLANMQRKVPVITTYHGSDINNPRPFLMSRLSIALSAHNIFVSTKLLQKSKTVKNYSVIPCGVDISIFTEMDAREAKSRLGLPEDSINVLFSSSFANANKNHPLAAVAIDILNREGQNVNLIELKGYTRPEVNLLMNAVDCLLLTSYKEGAPQVIREVMAVNNKAVSVDVGDVKEFTNGLEGYYICDYSPHDVAGKIREAIDHKEKTKGRERIFQTESDTVTVTNKLGEVYMNLLNNM